eukprot:c19880_g1_i1 orf=173-712(+)
MESGRNPPPPSASAASVSPQQVLSSLMNDGTFDSLRAKIISQLKQNEELKKYTTSRVEQSQVLNSPGAEQKSRRELFEALRRELEGPVLERASKAAWDTILSEEGVGKEIADTVYRAYNQLSNKDSNVYSTSDPHNAVTMNADDSTRSHNFTGNYANGQLHSVNPTHINTPRSGEDRDL